ncbi:hypothetical protein ACN081_04745 [Rothia sp. P13129]|uniref:hypothetical protein n=1 Tax=Rothia sp. P13129 TaxID=3402664 RepID=UPI003AC8EE03
MAPQQDLQQPQEPESEIQNSQEPEFETQDSPKTQPKPQKSQELATISQGSSAQVEKKTATQKVKNCAQNAVTKVSLTFNKKRARNAIKKVAFSPKSRDFARVVNKYARRNEKIADLLLEKGAHDRLERLGSERLEAGKYFAKLTIKNWEEYRDQKFRLYQNGKVVYGNQIEPPARGFPLEYRNIIVTSRDIANFSLSIDAPFTLAISEGAFTTEQQVKYDIQYGVEQHDNVFYSLRGNTTNPSKILITFPGFGPSTTRVSYAVSYLKALSDQDLSDTLMICFQDRYMVSGTYMMCDSSRRALYPKVKKILDNFKDKYGIEDDKMLFFGASKGGSIAIHYAQEYPQATLLLAVPQMNLPYYMNKPFFRYNLYGTFRENLDQAPDIGKLQQPEDLLRSYLEQKRTIHYFYTTSDELSNHSLIELVRGVPKLTKYRINGKHGEVARIALPSILNVIREFLGANTERSIACEDVRTFHDEQFLYSQLRIESGLPESASSDTETNWFIEADDEGTRLRVLLTSHSYDFVKYTKPAQRLYAAYDPIEKFDKIVGLNTDGTRYIGTFPERLTRAEDQIQEPVFNGAPKLSIDTQGNIEQYTIINGANLGRFQYRAHIINHDGVLAEVHIVDDINRASYVRESSFQEATPTKSLTVVESLDDFTFVQLFALRTVITSGCERLRIVLHSAHADAEIVKSLVKTDWIKVQVVVVRPVENLDIDRRPFANWIKKRRLNVLGSAQRQRTLLTETPYQKTVLPRRRAITPDKISVSASSTSQATAKKKAKKTVSKATVQSSTVETLPESTPVDTMPSGVLHKVSYEQPPSATRQETNTTSSPDVESSPTQKAETPQENPTPKNKKTRGSASHKKKGNLLARKRRR